MKDAMKALKHDQAYAVLFRHTSSIMHASDAAGHMEFTPGSDEPIFQIYPRLEGIDGPSFVARELFWVLARQIDRKLGLGFRTVLMPHKMTKALLAARRS